MRKPRFTTIGTALLVVSMFAAGLAAQPSNDLYSGRINLSLGGRTLGTLSGAINDYQLAAGTAGVAPWTGIGQTPSTAPGGDVVYAFFSPSGGSYSVRVYFAQATSNIVLYTSPTPPSGGFPQTIAANSAANRNTTVTNASECCLGVTMAAGTSIAIYVDEVVATAGSDFHIEILQDIFETEPNDTTGTADFPTYGIVGAIDVAGDIDFYDLGAPATGSRLFALIDGSAGNSNDFDLRVTTTTDTLEYDDTDADTPFGGISATIAGCILPGGQVYLRVTHFLSGTAAEPYRLYYLIQPPSAGSILETGSSNDTYTTAQFGASNYFFGNLSTETDVDFYGTQAFAWERLYVSLDCDPLRNGTPFNFGLEVQDSVGTVILTVNGSTATSNTTSGAGSLNSTTPNSPAESIVVFLPNDGNYYIRVFAAAGTGAALDYLLSISRGGALGGGGVAVPELDVVRGGAVADGGTDNVATSQTGVATVLDYDLVNSGTALLGLTPPVSITGQMNCTVVVTLQPPSSIGSGSDQNMTLEVTPTADGPWSFTVSLTNTDSNENPYNWVVSGTATADGGDDEAGCTTGGSASWLMIAGVLAALAVGLRLRRA